MNNIYIKYGLRFILLVILQILIMDRINLFGYVNPYFYVYFILLLPYEIKGWALLSVSFLLGLTIDSFSGTPGMHAFSTTLMAFIRPFMPGGEPPRKEFEISQTPSMKEMGTGTFMVYAFLLILIHHVTLFYVEVFRFTGFMNTFMRALASTVFTFILVVLVQYIFSRPERS